MAMNARQSVTIGRFGDALRSIATSTCCGDCQEAKRVARKALGLEQEGQAEALREGAKHRSQSILSIFRSFIAKWWKR